MNTDSIKTLNFWFGTFIFGCVVIFYNLTNVSQVDIFLKNTPLTFEYYSVKFNFYFGLYFVIVPLFFIIIHGTSLYFIGNFISTNTNSINTSKQEPLYSPFIFIFRYLNPEQKKNITDFISLSFLYLIFFILPPFLLLWFYWYFSKYQSGGLTFIHLSLIIADLFIVVTYGSTFLRFFDTHLRSNSTRWMTFPPKYPNFKSRDKSFKRNLMGWINPYYWFRMINSLIIFIILFVIVEIIFQRILCYLFFKHKHFDFHISIITDSIIRMKGYSLLIFISLAYFLFFLFVINIPSKVERFSNIFFFPKIEIAYYNVPIKSTPSLRNRNLLFLEIFNVNIDSSDFTNSNLYGARIKDTRINNSIFNGADIVNVVADSCNFSGSKFINASINLSRLNSAEFVNCNFANSKISCSSFNGSVFIGSSFENSKILLSEFCDTDFTAITSCKAELFCSDFGRSDFSGCDLRTVGIINSNMVECLFNGAIFRYCNSITSNDSNSTRNSYIGTNFVRSSGIIMIDSMSDHIKDNSLYEYSNKDYKELLNNRFKMAFKDTSDHLNEDFNNLKIRIGELINTNIKFYSKRQKPNLYLDQKSITLAIDSIKFVNIRNEFLFNRSITLISKPQVCFSDDDYFYKEYRKEYLKRYKAMILNPTNPN